MKPATFLLFLKGFCIGVADIIPGVSGGTMAIVLGIYTRLIRSIRYFDLEWLRALMRMDGKIIVQRPDLGFFLPLLVGVFCALLFFTRVLPLSDLIFKQPELVFGLFFGLISGSVVILLIRLPQYSLSMVFAGILAGIMVVNLIPAETPNSGWFLFICGVLSISAMILPGISGSFILLLMKKYVYIFSAIAHVDLSVIIPFFLGIITGLVLCVRLLVYLLRTYYQQSVCFMLGLLCTSLWVIWPFQQRVFVLIDGKRHLISSEPFLPILLASTTLYTIILATLGFVCVLLLFALARRNSSEGDYL